MGAMTTILAFLIMFKKETKGDMLKVGLTLTVS
jgi:hypothetical protein